MVGYRKNFHIYFGIRPRERSPFWLLLGSSSQIPSVCKEGTHGYLRVPWFIMFIMRYYQHFIVEYHHSKMDIV